MHILWKATLILLIFILNFGIRICTEEEIGVIDHPVVHTKVGSVRGNTHKVLNSSVHVFWSIPFAKPPVGEFRFKHPVPVDPWAGTLDGTRKPNACFQLGTEATWTLAVPESEDCLYLNVFVPKALPPLTNLSADGCYDGSNSNRTGLSVMFFIFGGGFIRGTTTIERYNSSILAVVNHVIVVTVSYRLGAFGFLFSGSPEAPGNAGIFDQLMALQWVHNNIQCFGGDPRSVTVFGGSAGAFSAGHLILSPLSRNLFHRAILMSGVPNSFAALSTSMLNSFLIIGKLGNLTGCIRSSPREIVICLKTVAATSLDGAQESFSAFYMPFLDGHLLPSHVTKLYDEAVTKNISVILGVTQDEGSMFLASMLDYESDESGRLAICHPTLHHLINTVVDMKLHLNPLQKETVKFLYNNWEDIDDTEANSRLANAFLGDCIFVCPANEFGHQLSDRDLHVYYYNFNHRRSHTPWPEWAGVVHGDDIFFVFGTPLEPKNEYSTEESQLSHRMIKAFGNFAKFGVPSYGGEPWPRYSRFNQTYVELNANGDAIKKGPRASQCGLWNHLLPKLIEKDDCKQSEANENRTTNNTAVDDGTLQDTEE